MELNFLNKNYKLINNLKILQVNIEKNKIMIFSKII